MSWLLDHVLLTAHDLPRSVAFYERILEARATQFELSPGPGGARATTDFAHLLGSDGSSLHLATPTPNFFALYRSLVQNSSAAHVAVTVPDVAAAQSRLEALGWLFMPPQPWGPGGYLRLYTEEPSLNLVELNQRVSGDGPSAERGQWRLDHVGLATRKAAESTAWFEAVLGTKARGGVFDDDSGHRLELRTPDQAPWLDPARRVALAVPSVAAVASRLEEVGLATVPAGDGILVADPSSNLIQVIESPF